MDLALIQTSLQTAVQTALGDLAYDVGWKHRDARWRSTRHVLLRVLSAPRKGRDERRYTAEGADDLRERIYGVRTLKIQITCEAQDQDLDESAWAAAEAVSTGLYASDVLTLLDAAGLGVASLSAPASVDYVDAQGRTRSAVWFEATFNTSTSKTGPLIPYVHTIEVIGDPATLTVSDT